MTVIECQNLIMVEIPRVLVGRSCRAGGSRASEQGGTGNSGCGHWWAFRLYFVNRLLGMHHPDYPEISTVLSGVQG